MPLLSKNDAYVATRAKSRKKSLIDSTRMRQLLQQTPEQLSISIADSGYRNEIDLYASGFQGSDLVEAALTHNLENELSNILNLLGVEPALAEKIFANDPLLSILSKGELISDYLMKKFPPKEEKYDFKHN